MGQVVLVEKNADLKRLLSANLSAYLGVNVVEREDAEDALNLLTLIPNVDLIIYRPDPSKNESIDNFVEELEAKAIQTSLIFLGLDTTQDGALGFKDPISWEKIIKSAANMLNISEQEMAKRIVPEFMPLPTNYFYTIDRSCTDVYIRIKKGDQYHYIRRIREGEYFEPDEIKKYEAQGLRYFYIKKSDQILLINFVSSKISEQLEDEEMTLDRRVAVTAHAFEVSGHQIRNLGLSPSTVQLADTAIFSMVESVNKIEDLGQLLKSFLDNKSSMAYNFCHLTSYIAYEIIRKTDWGTQTHHECLTFSAFFSDITLKDEKMILIRDNQQLINMNYDEKTEARVMYHAARAAELLQDHPEIPYGAEVIVREHHGIKSGVGFVNDYSEGFSILTSIFIIAQELAAYVMTHEDSETTEITTFTKTLKKKFTHPNYIKVIDIYLGILDKS